MHFLIALLTFAFSYSPSLQYSTDPEVFVYMDYENKHCYVDLMAIDLVVEQISLIDEFSQLLQRVDCSKHKPNEIIELDLSLYPKGRYALDFKTPFGSVLYPIRIQ